MIRCLALMLCVLSAVSGAVIAAEYEVGGPLEGPKLSLFPTHFGEEPGQPGCIPEMAATGKTQEDMGNAYRDFAPQGQ
jgi:hypothetical protein